LDRGDRSSNHNTGDDRSDHHADEPAGCAPPRTLRGPLGGSGGLVCSSLGRALRHLLRGLRGDVEIDVARRIHGLDGSPPGSLRDVLAGGDGS
jgi:hypothetical protein